MNMFSEHGFIMDKGDKNLGIAEDIGMLIKARKWDKNGQQPVSFNTKIMKEFYANLVDTNNKKDEIIVRGVKVSYAEGTINMHFHLKSNEDKYQELLDALDDNDFDVYMESLCNLGTEWVESGGEKNVKRMDLQPEMKVWCLVFEASTYSIPKEEIPEKPKSKLRKGEKNTPKKKGGVTAKDISKKIVKQIEEKTDE
ncbi:hypothetical protein RYX36_002803 [Vicia faba]